MATDYEQFYRDNPNALGEPTREFVDFFEAYDQSNAKVLDVGCGQGRDALFIARMGHTVHGVDISPTGVADLLASAQREQLGVTADVADIRDYSWPGTFDVILIDRTLHKLRADNRNAVLTSILATATTGTHVLIADERSNISGFQEILSLDALNWTVTMHNRGYLFAFAS
jgi:2-polyprenyl-3-methyl-5-hydroxy-6-metoxy-1,4-benzoquinol methylase